MVRAGRWLRGCASGALVALEAVLTLGALAATAPPAAAHVPFLEPDRSSAAPARPGDPFPGAIVVPDAAISRAVYGTLAHDAPFDAYRLHVSHAAVTPIELLIPQTGALRDFRPSFALVGFGLRSSGVPPRFIESRLAAAYGDRSFPMGDGPGVTVIGDPGSTPRSTFYEPFSFSRYYRGGKTTVTLPPGVQYYLVVWDPAGSTGPYAFGIGVAEKFSLGDVARSLVDVVRIKLGLYGQSAFSWRAAAALAALAAALIAFVVWLVRRRRRRRRPAGPAGTSGA
jgi:hypothetical protein